VLLGKVIFRRGDPEMVVWFLTVMFRGELVGLGLTSREIVVVGSPETSVKPIVQDRNMGFRTNKRVIHKEQ
jgi:hypothetical protein